MYHLYDSEGSDSEDEAERKEKREKLAALQAKLKQAILFEHTTGYYSSFHVGQKKQGDVKGIELRVYIRVVNGTLTLSLWEA